MAAVNVEAPVEAVWDVLTDYERLSEFIPNLALCERVQLPASAPSRFTRLRQVCVLHGLHTIGHLLACSSSEAEHSCGQAEMLGPPKTL